MVEYKNLPLRQDRFVVWSEERDLPVHFDKDSDVSCDVDPAIYTKEYVQAWKECLAKRVEDPKCDAPNPMRPGVERTGKRIQEMTDDEKNKMIISLKRKNKKMESTIKKLKK